MNLPKFIKQPAVGVDLGSRTIKGVKLKKVKGQIYLDRYFFHDLGQPGQANLAETLKANIELNKLTNAKVAVNIKDEEVFNFNFELPKMKDSEMRFAVAHEIQDSINIPIDELSFDYVVMDDASVALGQKVKVKAYCAKRDAIVARTEVLKHSKLKPGAVESDVLALVAMLGFNDYLTPGKNCAVFDIGESHISTALITDMELVFSKTGNIGCGSINQALHENLSLDYAECENLKVNHDFNQGMSTAAQDTVTGRIIDQGYFEIFKDIKETLEFFKEQLANGTKVDKILLVGGGGKIPNIEKVFELLFKVPTTIVNPFKNIQIYENNQAAQDEKIGKLGPYMATAVGLALREIA